MSAKTDKWLSGLFKGAFQMQDKLILNLHADSLEKVVIAIAIQWGQTQKNNGKSPKEALALLNIKVPSDIQDDWAFFNFLQFLDIDKFQLQKIELVQEFEDLRNKGGSDAN